MENNVDKKSVAEIEKIVEKINGDFAENSADTKIKEPDPSVEGFVFEYGTDVSSDNGTGEDGIYSDAAANAPESEEASPSSADGAGVSDAHEDASPSESDEIPEIKSEPVAAAAVWKTYVPRFTEASENYWLKGDARIRAQINEKNKKGIEDPADALEEEKLDPTAEIESESPEIDAKIPERKAKEENVESISIYKFASDDDFVEEIDGRTLEDEKKEIDELLKTDKPETPVQKEPEAVEETVEEDVDETADGEEREYSIPDPDKDDLSVYDCTGAAFTSEDKPEGVEESNLATLDKKGKVKDTEFSNPVQRDAFKDRFLDSILSIRIRFVFALLFTLSVFSVELLSAAGVIRYELFSSSAVSSALAILDFLFASCIFIFTVPEFVRAVKYLFKKKALPELMPIAAYLVLVGYTVAIVLTGAQEYPLFGFLFAMLAVPMISASLYRTKADFLAFKMVSQSEEKQILDKKNTRELPPENMALDGIVDEYRSKIARTFRVSFVSDFFKKSAEVGRTNTNVGVICCIAIAVALISGVVAFFLASSFVTAISVFTFVFMLACPAFSVMSGKIPFFHSQRAAVMEESAAIGEGAYYNFASVDVVAFDDTEIFGPDDVNLRRFMLYGDRDNMEKVMRQMCALFAVVGGPLDFIFTNAIDNRVRHKAATNTVVEDDGLCGMVMGHRISAGSEDYMRRNGIAIPEAALSAGDVGIDTTKVMYAAEDGVVYAKFYIRYSFSEEFTMVLPALKEEGVIPLVYTRDPNISNELLATLTAGSDCMRVVRQYTPVPTEEKVYSRVSADMITYGDKINAINMILLSKKYKRFAEHIGFAETCSSVIGMVLALVLAIIGLNGVAVIAAAMWHAIWCIALRFISKNVFLKEKRKKDED